MPNKSKTKGSATQSKPNHQLKMKGQQSQIEQQLSSEYSSEDDDAKLLTDKVQEKLLSVVAMIRNKHPKIYKVDKPIFEDNDFDAQEQSSRKEKVNAQKYTYKKMAQQQQESSQNQADCQNQLSIQKIKQNLKQKLKNEQKSQNQNDQMFTIKQKISNSSLKQKLSTTAPNQDNQNQKINTFLDETFKNSQDKSKQILGKLWSDSNLDQTDKFLRNYIVDRKWLTSKNNLEYQNQQAMIDEQDQERSVQMDKYEANYNFRFEEPDGNKIVQYPRSVPQSVRIKPESRKQKRKKLQQKKKQQQEQARKEAEEKKSHLKKEILRKLQNQQQLNMQNQMIDQQDQGQQLDHDWFFCDDCTKPLAQLQVHFVCPQCQDYMLCCQCYDLIIHKHNMQKGVIPKGAGPPKQEKAHKILEKLKSCLNCKRRIPSNLQRYQYTDRASYITSSLCQKCYDESNLEIKKKFKAIEPQNINYEQMLQKQPQRIKQLTSQKDIQQLVDEYIKNDYEDILADGTKAKFKYINVRPQSYGLSDEQILFGEDKQLNKYVSVKKLAPYRDDEGIMRLRSSIYNKKMKPIQKSIERNKAITNKEGAMRVRKIDKMKNRAEILRKRRENMRKKLRLVNISKVEDQKKYFIPNSRLVSYGLAAPQEKQYRNYRKYK